ncbi:unnamed protein product, partial [Heterosigma akashiwo]
MVEGAGRYHESKGASTGLSRSSRDGQWRVGDARRGLRALPGDGRPDRAGPPLAAGAGGPGASAPPGRSTPWPSATQAGLLGAGAGYEGLFFGRIDYQDRAKRIEESRMEMFWQGSISLPEQTIFTGAFHSGNYGAPEGFCFDTLCSD